MRWLRLDKPSRRRPRPRTPLRSKRPQTIPLGLQGLWSRAPATFSLDTRPRTTPRWESPMRNMRKKPSPVAAVRSTRKLVGETSMNMVLVIPSEFSTTRGQTNGLDNDVAEEQLDQRPKTKEELLAVAFDEVIPRDEPNKYRHLKPLYISAHVEGVPVSKVFVDCGATVNILPYSLMKKLDKSKEDLIPSDVVMSSFVGDKSKTIGYCC
ncbi:unnamed protein product [Prunus armeniaca]